MGGDFLALARFTGLAAGDDGRWIDGTKPSDDPARDAAYPLQHKPSVRGPDSPNMEVIVSERSEFPSESYEKPVSPEAVAEHARRLLIAAGGSPSFEENRKSWLARAARRCGLSFARARAIFYREARRIDAHELVRVALAAGPNPLSMQKTKEQIHATDRAIRGVARAVRTGVDHQPTRLGFAGDGRRAVGGGGAAGGRRVAAGAAE